MNTENEKVVRDPNSAKIGQLVLELKCLGEVAEVEGMTVEGNPLHPMINEAWQTIVALQSQSNTDGWVTVGESLPPEGELVCVFWVDADDMPSPERYDFDYLEDGAWIKHEDDYQHFISCAPAGSTGPSEDAPYTHWKRLGSPFAAPTPPQQVSNTPQDDLIALHGDGVLDSVSEEFRLQCVQQEQSGEAVAPIGYIRLQNGKVDWDENCLSATEGGTLFGYEGIDSYTESPVYLESGQRVGSAALYTLLEYCERAEDCQMGTLAIDLVQRLVNEALSTTTPTATASQASREEQMVSLRTDESGNPTVWCDPEIADLVDALNTDNLSTVASCSGHEHRPGRISLKDGRELLVMNSEQVVTVERLFGTDINGASQESAPGQEAMRHQILQSMCKAMGEVLAIHNINTADIPGWMGTWYLANAAYESMLTYTEALMMKVAESACDIGADAMRAGEGVTDAERRAIVRRVLDEMKGE